MGDDYVMRQECRWTFSYDGEVTYHDESMIEVDGRPVRPDALKIDRAGTWLIDNEALIVDMPTRRTPRMEMKLVERRASDGLTRVVLRSSCGGVCWRPETE